MAMEAMVVMDMVVTDTVDTVERDQLSHTMAMVDTEDTVDMAVDTVVMVDMATVDIAARDLLMPSTVVDMVMVVDMEVMVDTEVMADMAMVDTVARDLLMLNQKLKPLL